MTSQSMRDRLIRAVGDYYDGYADPVDTPSNWRRAEGAVEALIAVLREPDDGMVDFAVNGEYGGLNILSGKDAAKEQFTAMIDAIK